MFDQVLDNLRMATDSTIQLQQEMFRQWFQQWPQVLGIPWMRERVLQIRQALLGEGRPMTPAADYLDLLQSGTLEDAFRVAETKDPAQFCKLTEELWRNSFDCSKTAMEAQLREFQAAMEKGFEAVSKGVTAAKGGTMRWGPGAAPPGPAGPPQDTGRHLATPPPRPG